MSTAVAMAPSPAPHDRTAFPSDLSSSPAAQRSSAASSAPAPLPAPTSSHSATPNASLAAQRSGSGSPRGAQPAPAAAKSSPPSAARNGNTPKIFVKKEPGSPDNATPRRRPGRLDLSKGGSSGSNLGTGRPPLTAREGLGIHEVGLACLSPGFVTQDPVMKEQLQRSMSVREQQRHIIEARLQQQSAKGDGPDMQQPSAQPSGRDKDGLGQFAAKTPGISSRRNKAPPGLSIVAPSHEQFANERVIQSAPLGQTFTGMHNPHPLTRHISNQPSKLSNTSHIHHVPANQTNNRLPPLSDVFGHHQAPLPSASHPPDSHHALFAQQQTAAARAPIGSPGHPPPQHGSHGPHAPSHHHSHQGHPPQPPPVTSRPREYKSAEEAQAELAGGRPELLPKIVHYGGHQPPTPPSPQPGGHQSRPAIDGSRSASRRRTRAEYEEGGTPPLGTGRATRPRGPFGEGRDSPESQRQKREEFLRLCERAWDLFHS